MKLKLDINKEDVEKLAPSEEEPNVIDTINYSEPFLSTTGMFSNAEGYYFDGTGKLIYRGIK